MDKNSKQIESEHSTFYEFLSEKYNIQCFNKVNKFVGNKIYNKYFPIQVVPNEYIYFYPLSIKKPIQYHHSILIDDIYLKHIDWVLSKKR